MVLCCATLPHVSLQRMVLLNVNFSSCAKNNVITFGLLMAVLVLTKDAHAELIQTAIPNQSLTPPIHIQTWKIKTLHPPTAFGPAAMRRKRVVADGCNHFAVRCLRFSYFRSIAPARSSAQIVFVSHTSRRSPCRQTARGRGFRDG